MSRIVTVQLLPSDAERVALIHRFKNFGEEIFRYIRDSDLGRFDLHQIDIPGDHYVITDVKGREACRLIAWIEQEAIRQNLAVEVEFKLK